MCCKLLRIDSLDKPRLSWCTHCDIGVGCKIYDDRPAECRIFNCGFLTDANIGEHWYPAKSKMVISLAGPRNRMMVYVDPDRPRAWRQEPYYSDLKRWARAALAKGGQVLVAQGLDTIVVTPDGEKSIGQVRDDQHILSRRKRGPKGVEIEHIIVDQDDPILEEMRLLKDGANAPGSSRQRVAEANRKVEAWLARRGG